MGIVRKSVQEQIGVPLARQMIRDVGELRREYQPLRGNTASLGLPAQIGHCNGMSLAQPQNAIRCGPQEPHPKLKHLRHNFVRIVE